MKKCMLLLFSILMCVLFVQIGPVLAGFDSCIGQTIEQAVPLPPDLTVVVCLNENAMNYLHNFAKRIQGRQLIETLIAYASECHTDNIGTLETVIVLKCPIVVSPSFYN